jgi:hypothetical protein
MVTRQTIPDNRPRRAQVPKSRNQWQPDSRVCQIARKTARLKEPSMLLRRSDHLWGW